MQVTAAPARRGPPRPDARPIRDLVIRRAGIGTVTLLVVSVVVFAATQVLPGNAAFAVLGRSANPARLHALERQLHLNRGLADQYWTWLSGLFSGRLGNSFANGQPVWALVEPRLVNSAVLVLLTGAIGTVAGIVLGAVAALRKDGWFDHLSSVAALAVTSLPEFLILPVATLVIVIFPYLFRMMRGAMIEALESDYVEMARLKGVPEWRIVLVHALPNAIAPTIQVIGLNFLYLAGGVVVVEYVFNFPGIGQGLVFAVDNRDIPVIQLIVVVLAAFYVCVNIVSDVIALLASPRRRIPR